jgi:C_GCAxxG_C_C family probable redox protein
MDKKMKAIDLFGSGCNCSQAVLMAYADDFGIEDSVVERIAVPFGGGMSKHGKACGCLSGALMVIGLKYGTESTKIIANRGLTYSKGSEFIKLFRDSFGAEDCRELIKLDLNKKEDLEIANRSVFGTRCKDLVGKTVELLESFLTE